MPDDTRPEEASPTEPHDHQRDERNGLPGRLLVGLREAPLGPPGADVGEEKWLRAADGWVSRPRWSKYAGYVTVFLGAVGLLTVVATWPGPPWSSKVPIVSVVAAAACLLTVVSGAVLQRRRERMLAELDWRLKTIQRYRKTLEGRIRPRYEAPVASSPLYGTLVDKIDSSLVGKANVMENVPDPYCEVDRASDVIFEPNPRFEECFPGVTKWSQIVLFREHFRKALDRVSPDAPVSGYALTLQDLQGKLSYWEAVLTPRSLVEPGASRIGILARPLSARYDDLPVGLYHTNSPDEGKVIYCNRKFAEIVGREMDDIVRHRRMADFYADSDDESGTEVRKRLLSQFEEKDYLESTEVDFSWGEAEEESVHVLISCRRNPETDQVLGVLQDVSYYRKLIENPVLGTYLIQADCRPEELDPSDIRQYSHIRFKFVNKHYREVFGYKGYTQERFCAEVKPKDVVFDTSQVPTYQSLVAKLTGRRREPQEYQFTGVDHDGKLLDVDIMSMPIPSYLGSPAVVGFLRVIPPEQAISGRAEDTPLTRFLLAVAHDESRDLAHLRDSLDSLIRTASDSRAPYVQELVRVREDAVNALSRFLLLRAAGSLEGRFAVQDVAVGDVLRMIFNGQEFAIGEQNEFSCEVRRLKLDKEVVCRHERVPVSYKLRGDYHCVANREALLYCLQQTTHNALKHLPATAPRLYIEVSKRRRRVYILVANNGDSIPEKNRNRVFEQFYTTDGKENGMGFGLFMVRSFLNKMDGTITVQPPPDWVGAGTAMLISLERRMEKNEVT